MQKPRKAYLVEESHTGFGFRVSPVLVLNVDGKLATVALLNVTENRAWVPTAGAAWPVRVSSLASTRTKALAMIAVRLRDLSDRLDAHFAMSEPQPASAAPTSASVKSPPAPAWRPSPPANPRRANRQPWYAVDR